jgi:hypothetical protein
LQAVGGTYAKHLAPWHKILLTCDYADNRDAYYDMHPMLVRQLIKHYHKPADPAGEKQRPFVAEDFDKYIEAPKDMALLLQAIERAANDNYIVEENSETRLRIVTEFARCKWQNKPPAPAPWYYCRHLRCAHTL